MAGIKPQCTPHINGVSFQAEVPTSTFLFPNYHLDVQNKPHFLQTSTLALRVWPKTLMVLCRLGSGSQKSSQELLESLPWASVKGKEKPFLWSVKTGQFGLSQRLLQQPSAIPASNWNEFLVSWKHQKLEESILFSFMSLTDFHWHPWDGGQAHFPHPSLGSFSLGTWTRRPGGSWWIFIPEIPASLLSGSLPEKFLLPPVFILAEGRKGWGDTVVHRSHYKISTQLRRNEKFRFSSPLSSCF